MTSCLLQLSDRHCRRCDEQASATPRHRQDPARDGGSAGADRCLLADQPRRSPNLPRSRRAAPTSVFLGPTSLPVSVCMRACVRACVRVCVHACLQLSGRPADKTSRLKIRDEAKKYKKTTKGRKRIKRNMAKEDNKTKKDKKRNKASGVTRQVTASRTSNGGQAM